MIGRSCLAYYHRQNAYMIKHWDQADHPWEILRRSIGGKPKLVFPEPVKNPLDHNALNGLGNIFLFQGELNAAEFFVNNAIKCAKEKGVKYREAKHDLALIRRRLGTKSHKG